MTKPLWIWASFFAVVVFLLVFDLGLLRRRAREISIRESLWLSLSYVCVSLCFGAGIFHYLGAQDGKDFLTGYLVEKSLSADNIFIISLVFSHFYIPRRYQHRVLLWGVLGAVVLRGIMIGLGAVLTQQFHPVLYLFGAFLLFTGARMLFFASEGERNLKDNKMLLWLERHMAVTPSLHENKFFVHKANAVGKTVLHATPLLLVLVFIELADIVFAVDSVPAVFAVTTDPFIVYTSNIFAILGLRALYFAFAAMLHRFSHLKYALALVLMFIGGKIFLVPFTGPVSSTVSLGVTLALLTGGIVISLYKTPQ